MGSKGWKQASRPDHSTDGVYDLATGPLNRYYSGHKYNACWVCDFRLQPGVYISDHSCIVYDLVQLQEYNGWSQWLIDTSYGRVEPNVCWGKNTTMVIQWFRSFVYHPKRPKNNRWTMPWPRYTTCITEVYQRYYGQAGCIPAALDSSLVSLKYNGWSKWLMDTSFGRVWA